MPDISAEIERLRRGAASVLLDHLALIELRGEDRLSWLQGQSTQDLRGLDARGADLCLCRPTGQLEAIARAWPLADRLLLAVDAASVAAVLARAVEMVILEDVAASVRDGRLVAVQGPQAFSVRFDGERLPIDRSGSGGWAAILPVGAAPEEFGLPEPISEAALQVLEIEAGVPRYGVDADERTLPPELGPAFERRAISYSKGCYAGQEVLMRIHSRGHTNRTWVGLVAEAPLEAGQAVAYGERDDVGRITRAAISPEFGPIAAAMVRNEVAAPGAYASVAGVRAEVREMPLFRGMGTPSK